MRSHLPTRWYLFAMLLLTGCVGPPQAEDAVSEEAEVVSQSEAADPTSPPAPTQTPIAQLSPSPTLESTDADPAPELTDEHGIHMLLVPAGEFIMGSEGGFHDEQPVHTVYLDDYYMDLYEVTNADYAACVDAGGCQPPRITGSRQRYEFYGEPEFDNHPAVYLSWNDAHDYCTWRGARLPTEAEWEKAARGTDGRTFAWGNQSPSVSLTNYAGSHIWDTVEVGLYPAGVSPYGLHDMSGNVYEWVWDRYAEDYYSVSPEANPQGPSTGQWRITKGGSFWNWDYRLRAANRNNTYLPPDSVHWDGGARCARSS